MKNLKTLTGPDFSFMIGIIIVVSLLVTGFIVK
jgi:hypothetical protein